MSGKEFKQLLDTVCNGGTSEPNWGGIMEIVEIIKKREFSAKKASIEVRKKLLESKESTVLNAMFVVESIVKNTPSSIHREFLSPELLGSMKALVENQDSGMSRAIDKVLEVLGEWKAVFGEDSAYRGVTNVFADLEKGGYYIPEATIASASYIKKGPDFQESDNCSLCDKKFNKLSTRRHHCRNCGKSICGSCQGEKKLDLPHFDFDAPQIVCLTCYKKLEKPSETSESTDAPPRTGPSPQPPAQGNSEELQLQEEEDLQMAIAISLNEQENKKKKTNSTKPVSETLAPPTFADPPTTVPSAPPSSLYGPIYADLDFSQATPTTSTASVPKMTDKGTSEFEQYSSRGQKQRAGNTTQTQPQQQPIPLAANGATPLCSTLHRLIDQFSQRMDNVSSKGLSIATDQAILSLHQDLTALHMQLLQQIDETQEKKTNQERFLHKLGEAKEARVTFDTMKRRHEEQLLQQEREQQALAQMQVQMKLALLRQQKAEQMAYGQSMQSERLNRLSTQRAEYEKTLAMQRENERLKLISIEEQVYKQQFGGLSGGAVGMETGPYGAPPPPHYGAPPTSMAPPPPPPLESYGGGNYAGPLPTKVDPSTYQTSYQPTHPQTGYVHPPPTQPVSLPTQPVSLPTQPVSLPAQPVPPPTHYQAPTLYQPSEMAPPPPPPNYAYSSQYVAPPSMPPPSMAPPSMAPPTLAAPPYVPSSSTEMPLYGSNEAPPPPELQRVPSVPPLISFD